MKFGAEADSAYYGGQYYGSWYYAQASVDPTKTPATRPIYYRGYRANEVAAYVQDDWRLHPRLTVNLGLRSDYFGPPHNFEQGLDSNMYTGSPAVPYNPAPITRSSQAPIRSLLDLGLPLSKCAIMKSGTKTRTTLLPESDLRGMRPGTRSSLFAADSVLRMTGCITTSSKPALQPAVLSVSTIFFSVRNTCRGYTTCPSTRRRIRRSG